MTSGVNLLYSEYNWDSQREKNCALYLSDLFNYVFCAVGRNDGVFYSIADCWQCLWHGVVVFGIGVRNLGSYYGNNR